MYLIKRFFGRILFVCLFFGAFRSNAQDFTVSEKAAAEILKRQILKEAAWALKQQPVTVTAAVSPRSAGGKHDFYSEGDYWWPDPSNPEGPYVQRDGMTNPENFTAHRLAMIRFSRIIGALASAYQIKPDPKYVEHAVLHLKAWFVDPATRMNPNLQYAQAIKGLFTGRGIGIIDTIHLMDVSQGTLTMESQINPQDLIPIKSWFREYLQWLLSYPNGKAEMNAKNNHGTCFVAQVASFAKLTANQELLRFCRDRYKNVLLPEQMAADGSFPLELARTKPYAYSLFNLDVMALLCQILSCPGNDLWNYETPGGKSIKKGVQYLYPFIADKRSWPLKADVMYWKEWPVAQPSLLFAALAFQRQEWFDTWKKLDRQPKEKEVLRNLPVKFPLIWIGDSISSPVQNASLTKVMTQTELLIAELEQIKKTQADKELISPRTLENGKLKLVSSRDWTSGFFAGELWYLYELSSDEKWKILAEKYTAPIEREKLNGVTHDMGFKIYCSVGNGYRLTAEPHYREVLVQAAKTLSSRFNPKVGLIRSWDHHSGQWAYPVIIDNMLNLELLFAASKLTGDSSFYRIAVSHADLTMKNHFRADFSTFHVVSYNPRTGAVEKKQTHQGFSDASAWARGQAWALYGYTMCYRETKNPAYLKQAEHVASYIFSHKNMPKDLVPYWDFDAPHIPNEPRDVSAATVIASALYELSTCAAPGNDYRAKADIMMNHLAENYASAAGENKGFILGHSTGSKPMNSEVDVPLSYADYYYLEALIRKKKLKTQFP